MGCLIYEVIEFVKGKRRVNTRVRNLCICIIAGILMTIFCNVHFPGIGKLPEDSNLFMNYQIVLLLTFWPAVVFLAARISLSSRMTSVGKTLGKLATSIYIWHWPILYIQYALVLLGKIKCSMGSMVGFLLAFGITFAISILSAGFIERKTNIWIRMYFGCECMRRVSFGKKQ